MNVVSHKTGLTVLVIGLLLSACGGGKDSAPDPLVEGFPIAYVKRSIPTDDQGNIAYPDIRDPIAFNAGAELYIREHASSSAKETNITASVLGVLGDIKDVEVSYDGSRLLFAMRLPEISDNLPSEQPTWNIWEYNISDQRLRRIIKLDAFSEEGQDVAPVYLPDGRILFSSTRQQRTKEVLLDEGKPRYVSLVAQSNTEHAMMLHVMNADGTEIKQLTFSNKRDLDAIVLDNGKILFSRWERDRRGTDEINLYTIKPDGSELRLIYGSNSHDTGTDNSEVQFTQPRIFHDGRLLTIVRPYTGTFGGGDPVLIETNYFVDNDRPNKDNLGLPGTAQASLSNSTVSTLPGPSTGGRYASIFPLVDGTNRSLVSWSQCRYMDGNTVRSCANQTVPQGAQAAPPFYGLFVQDHETGTRMPIIPPREGVMIDNVVVTQDRDYPQVLEDATTADGVGYLHIRSIYDFDGEFRPASVQSALAASVKVPNVGCGNVQNNNLADITLDERAPQNPQEMADYGVIDNSSARFLRLVRPMIMPDRSLLETPLPNFAFGRNGGRDGFIEIIGYAPIEPDGSVKVKVPADVPFSFQIVDAKGRRLNIPNAQDNRAPRHFSWLQVKSGETLECNGCHQRNNPASHGTYKATASVNTGASSSRSYACMEPAMVANYQETMAETRTRICETEACQDAKPTVDIIYEDIWTRGIDSLDSQPVFAKGTSLEMLYNNLDVAMQRPVRQSCTANWSPDCRVEINYEQHIAPLWLRARTDSLGDPVSCGMNGCHSPVAADDVSTQVPKPEAGSQLNLTENNDLLDQFDNQRDNQNHIKSYRELFTRDNKQEVFDPMGPLVDVLVDALVDDLTRPILDPDTGEQMIDPDSGDPLFEQMTIQVTVRTDVGPPMSGNGANASTRFFNEIENDIPIEPGNEYDHSGLLSPDELKLVSEWLDNGAQYYSNPFSAP